MQMQLRPATMMQYRDDSSPTNADSSCMYRPARSIYEIRCWRPGAIADNLPAVQNDGSLLVPEYPPSGRFYVGSSRQPMSHVTVARNNYGGMSECHNATIVLIRECLLKINLSRRSKKQ